MSHIVTIKTKVRDAAALAAACLRRGVEPPVIGTVQLGIREDYIRTSSEQGPAVLVGVSLTFFPMHVLGPCYGGCAAILGAVFLWDAWKVGGDPTKPAT